jgi:ACS family hexuronate transporter-like MFS transporter
MDRLGTRKGFAITMAFWSLACMSHGVAMGTAMLATSRLLLGIGEGGGIPAATRAVVEWFPVRERSTAMGIINAGTAVGAVVAPPLIAVVLSKVGWLNLAHWRWVFFITGAFGFAWIIWWLLDYFPPADHPGASESELNWISAGTPPENALAPRIAISRLVSFPETWGIVTAKFLSDAAWYFYLFWLPKYFYDARGFDIKDVGTVGWIPFAASGVGCLCGGGLSSLLLHRGFSVNASRKIALGLSAALMPWVIFIPRASNGMAIALFSLAFFGQQSWSTLVMILPTDLFPRSAVGTVAGMVGFGGAMGGILLGQLAGYLLDHGFGYGPVLGVAGSLHVIAFGVILTLVSRIRPVMAETRGFAVEMA